MKLGSFLFTSFVVQFACAQEISIQNNNPPSVRWSQVNTPSFRILFPGGFEKQAQRVANTMEHIREAEEHSMGVKPRKISILLQNQTSISNGFVSLAPRRSEFLTMPPQDYNFAGTNDWLNLLAVHEYRHVVQYQRSIVGFNKLVYYAFGQQALALLAFTAAPQWFWEGDAVAVETAITGSGRGRIPHFNLLLRTNLLEGRTFHYSKQYLRSYKHNISDHYVLGYHMISYLRRKTNDANIWEKVVRRAWSAPFIPFAFSRSIRKESGLRVEQLYREMADSLRTEWQRQADAVEKTKFQPVVNRSSQTYTDYRYPQLLDDGSVVVMKSGIGDIPQLIQFKDGKQQLKYVVGPWNDAGMLSSSNRKVVWSEFRYDPRWRMRTYSIIKALDFETGKSRVLSRKSRYASVAISPDGSKVAAVESTVGYESRLVVIDCSSRDVLKVFENPDQHFISMPRWSNDGQSIVALRLSSAGKVISRFDLTSGAAMDLASFGNENVGHPVLHNNYLFYNSPYSGIDNIYVLDISSGSKFQVTTSKLGSYNPAISPDGEWIYYNEQTKNGMDVVRMAFGPSLWIPLGRIDQPKENLVSHLVEQEGHPDLMNGVPTEDYPVRPYHKWKGVINPHSWGPFFSNSVTTADFGISSRDLLGTTVLNAGYSFDINERTGLYKAGLSYQGIYPVLDYEVTHGNRELLTRLGIGANALDVKFSWKETNMSGAVRLPFLLTRSKFITSLVLKNAVGLTQVSQFENRVSQGAVLLSRGSTRQIRLNNNQSYIFAEQISNGFLRYNVASLSFSHSLRKSRRDINPRWGTQIELEHYSTPYGGDFNGSLAVARSVFYFPGILKHHSLMIRANYQNGSGGFDPNRYAFRSRVFRPRGFAYPHDAEFTSLSANYILPLWYPDIAVGPLVNFQRVRANLFYDYGDAKGNVYVYRNDGTAALDHTTDKVYQSVGAEIKFDINIMRLLPQLDIGFRVTYGLSHKESSMFEFLLGTLNL